VNDRPIRTSGVSVERDLLGSDIVAKGTVRVVMFAGLVEPAGGRALEIEWEGGSVADLRRQLVAMRPAMEQLLSRSAVAVNGACRADDADVPGGAEVAVLPPVSGG
jgi:molybdopterin converting factor small subunit